MTRLLLNTILVFAMFSAAASAQQAPASHYDPGAASRRQQKNPLDFLNQLNRKNTDVGQCIEDARRIAIESSIYEFSFWVNVATSVTLVAFFFWILRLRGERKQLIFSTAQVAAKYQNQIATGQQNYKRLHEVYRQYLDELDREKEPKLALKAPQPRGRNAGDQRETAGDWKAVPAAVATASLEHAPAVNQPAPSDALFQSLLKQIAILREQLEQERQKNRKLRGE